MYKFIKSFPLFCLTLCTLIPNILLAQTSDVNNALETHVVMETPLKDNDGTHLTLDFGRVPLDSLKNRLFRDAGFAPIGSEKYQLLFFIPKDLTEADKIFFLSEVERQINFSNNKFKVKIIPVEIDVLQMQAESENVSFLKDLENSAVTPEDQKIVSEIKTQNRNFYSQLKKWQENTINLIHSLKKWKRWPAEQKNMFVGSVVGVGKSFLSVGYWMGSTGLNIYGGAQSLMSIFLDFTFARWGHRINNWKATHRIPEIKSRHFPTFNRMLQYYNDNVVIKDFVINNLIGISAGVYFRLMSWMQDSTGKVQSPFSYEFAEIVLGGMTIGGVMGTLGGQGVRTLRKKNYLSVRMEYAFTQIFGVGMQIGGYLQGSGYTKAFWTYLYTEAAIKGAIYLSSRFLPRKTRRILVFHPQIDATNIKDLLYRHGLYDAYDISKPRTQELIAERLEGKGPTRAPRCVQILRAKLFSDK